MNHIKNLCIILLCLFAFRADLLAEQPASSEIPYIKGDYLHQLLGGPWSDVWTSKWPDANQALCNDTVRQIVKKDLEALKQCDIYFKPWEMPPQLIAVKKNPKNGLIYFLFEPTNSNQVLDANIVYIYDSEDHWFICKTSVDLGR